VRGGAGRIDARGRPYLAGASSGLPWATTFRSGRPPLWSLWWPTSTCRSTGGLCRSPRSCTRGPRSRGQRGQLEKTGAASTHSLLEAKKVTFGHHGGDGGRLVGLVEAHELKRGKGELGQGSAERPRGPLTVMQLRRQKRSASVQVFWAFAESDQENQ